MKPKRIHMARRRRAVLARYKEFLQAIRPTNIRDIEPRLRVDIADAIRRNYPREILCYVWRGDVTFETLVLRVRESIAMRRPEFRWDA